MKIAPPSLKSRPPVAASRLWMPNGSTSLGGQGKATCGESREHRPHPKIEAGEPVKTACLSHEEE